ncbi:MAG TPA: aldehyde dehydrogenase family protein [Steroidobacteraceae bacterium]
MHVRNPRTGKDDFQFEPAGPAALDAIASRLRSAQPQWAARTPQRRAEALLRWAAALESHAARIIGALESDTGRRALSRIELASVAGLSRRWAARAPTLIEAQSRSGCATSQPGITTSTQLVPYPLVGIISPWNFPLILSLIDAVPALAAGCAVMIKPSEIAPRFVEPLEAATRQVPEVADVLAFVPGDAATGAALIDRVDFVCFTGSVATGRKVAAAAAAAFIPASLELGGKDPMIVMASADPHHAAQIALRAGVVNTGQACQSIECVLVARAISGPFIAALTEAADRVRLNHPDIGSGDIGPFISQRQAQIVAAQIADALAKGARVLSGGEVLSLGGGLYLKPTVICDVTSGMRVLEEETFGPIIPVIPFDTLEEAVRLANRGRYGLSAAVLAATAEEAEAVASQLQVGAVSINDGSLTALVWEAEKTSFKDSGLGPSRMGDCGLTRFLRRRVLIRQSGAPAPLAAYAEKG